MDRIKWAEKKAHQLLGNMGINKAPIAVDELAMNLNIVVSNERLPDDVSGFLYRDDTYALIGVNENHPTSRQRFTLAHELGHYVMHEGDYIDDQFRINFRDITSSTGTKMNEIEANAFAAALLMPEHLVREAVARLNDGIELLPFSENEDVTEEIPELAKIFDVSHQALLIRLGKLGLLV